MKLSMLVFFAGRYVGLRSICLLTIQLCNIPSLDKLTRVCFHPSCAILGILGRKHGRRSVYTSPKKIVREFFCILILLNVWLWSVESYIAELLLTKGRAHLHLDVFVRLLTTLLKCFLSSSWFRSFWSQHFVRHSHYRHLVIFFIQVFLIVGLVIVTVNRLLMLRWLIIDGSCCNLRFMRLPHSFWKKRTFHNVRWRRWLIENRLILRIVCFKVHALSNSSEGPFMAWTSWL